MEKEELEQQRRVIEIKRALFNLGFDEERGYFRKGGNTIKVYESDKLEDVFKRLISFGETNKLWEIQRVLGINF